TSPLGTDASTLLRRQAGPDVDDQRLNRRSTRAPTRTGKAQTDHRQETRNSKTQKAAGHRSKAGEAGFRIPKTLQLHSHSIQDRQVHAAQLAVVVAAVEIIQHPAGLQGAVQSA